MRVSVNLASRPFVELRPFFFRLRLLMALLALLGIGLAAGAHVISAKAETQQIALDKLRNLTIATQNAKLQTEQRLREPENAAVLDRAHFLNALFLRKSFSWTAVMMDLEDVLPVGVQVTSIEPAVTADGAVIIRLRVAGERDRAVQLVRNLERSHRFLQPRLGSESAQTKEATGANGVLRPTPGVPAAPLGVEFEVLANYNPLPPGQAYHAGHARDTATLAPVAGTALAKAPLSVVANSAAPATMAERIAAAAAANIAAAGRGQAGEPISPPGTSPVHSVRGGAASGSGYPRDGVVLPPFGGPPRPQDGRLARQSTNAQGGGPQ